MWIGAREVAFDDAKVALVFEYCRQVASVKPGRPGGDQRRQRVRAHQRAHLRYVIDTEMIGQVHGAHSMIDMPLCSHPQEAAPSREAPLRTAARH